MLRGAEAQPLTKPIRIGLLDIAPGGSRQVHWDAFHRRLRELGYREGVDYSVELRSAGGQAASLAGLAEELVRLRVHIIVAASTPAVIAAKRATSTIPIVMTHSADPVGSALVASLPRPGGNVTGLTTLSTELSAKRLELVREIVPGAVRIAVLRDTTDAVFATIVRDTEIAGRSLGLQILVSSAGSAAEIERAFAAVAKEQAQAVVATPGPVFLSERKRLAELATKYRLPVVYTQREFVDAGGLMAYGASLSDLFARAGQYVDRIARGARPADLPVEQPTKFELTINMSTARMLGMTVPPALLLRADHVLP